MVKKRNKNVKLKKKEKKYISVTTFQQKEYPMTFLLGARGCGKTVSSFVSMIKEFLETGSKGIYLRRYLTEIETTSIDLSLLSELTGAEITRDTINLNSVSTDMILVNGEPAIYMLALSVVGKYKSSSFADVSNVYYDEFLDLFNRELKNETNIFLQFMMTVYRKFERFKCIFLANATNLFNCYFLDFEVLPTGMITRFRDKGIKIVMYQTSEELKAEQQDTTLAKLVSMVEGEENSSLNNQFTGNYTDFISKLPKNAKYVGTYKLDYKIYGVYKVDWGFIISNKADEMFKNKNALSYDDVDEDYPLIDWSKYANLRGLFMTQHVRFTDVKTRTAFMKRFKRMSLYND